MVTVIKAASVPRLGRGGGVETIPLITRQSAAEDNKITTGISIYPAGTGAPLHLHNCDEHVTLLEGSAEVEIAGQVTPLQPPDTTYVEAGVEHAFRNTGDTPMKILWVTARPTSPARSRPPGIRSSTSRQPTRWCRAERCTVQSCLRIALDRRPGHA